MAKLDPRKVQPAERDRVNTDGEVLGTTRFYPAVLPMSGINFAERDWPHFHVFALTNKGGAKKGGLYTIKAVTATGKLVLTSLPGTHDMGDYVEAFRGAFEPEAANENAETPKNE